MPLVDNLHDEDNVIGKKGLNIWPGGIYYDVNLFTEAFNSLFSFHSEAL